MGEGTDAATRRHKRQASPAMRGNMVPPRQSKAKQSKRELPCCGLPLRQSHRMRDIYTEIYPRLLGDAWCFMPQLIFLHGFNSQGIMVPLTPKQSKSKRIGPRRAATQRVGFERGCLLLGDRAGLMFTIRGVLSSCTTLAAPASEIPEEVDNENVVGMKANLCFWSNAEA